MTRAYRKTARADTERRTRDRIVDAAEAYYCATGIGPANISAIAKRAAVQRLTLYRHFANDDALLEAVLARWDSAYAWPTDTWSTVADPRQRVRVALEALYQYYAAAEPSLTVLTAARDRSAAAARWMDDLDRRIAAVRDRLADGWSVSGRPRRWLDALLGHALQSGTWRSLARDGGLGSSDAARLMARAAADIAREPYA